jgi:hypothetical protein
MFLFLLAKPEFHSNLASWRVVIRTLGFVSLQTSLHFTELKEQSRTKWMSCSKHNKSG